MEIREAILELSCNSRLDLEQAHSGRALGEHFSAELQALEPMRRDGLVALEGGTLQVTELGKPYVRNICMVFDQYLPAQAEGRFSRTS